jgi:serine/threonine protein kinase
VTPLYRAPEVFIGSSNYSTAVDIWSVGCIFAELLTGKPLFNGNQELDVLHKIYQLLGMPEQVSYTFLKDFSPVKKIVKFEDLFENLDENGLDLISKMLVLDPQKRITAYEALEHPFFSYEI